MSTDSPWDYHPDLTQERLSLITEVIKEVRNSTIDTTEAAHKVPWGTGCMVYDRTRERLTSLCNELSWLNVFDSQGHVFLIGSVPVRIFKGSPERPTTKTLAVKDDESLQLCMAFNEEVESELIWRFAVDTSTSGKALSVHFVGLTRSGQAMCRWSPRLHDSHSEVVKSFPKEESIKLVVPPIGSKKYANSRSSIPKRKASTSEDS